MRYFAGEIRTAPRPSDATTVARARMVGLDGVRGIAVALVVVYHLWPEVLPGGFLGVTVFFALSGFLIVGLLCTEHERSGRIELGAFALRRVRRLLPLSILVLVVVTLVWTFAGWMTAALRREVSFSVVQLANWGQLTAGVRYGVEATPSPVVHYWSLAIEEQVYVVLPLVVVALGARRWLVAAVVGAGVAVSVLLTVRWAGDATTVYFSTFTRMGEIFVGALVAMVVFGRTSDRYEAPVWLRRVGAAVAVAAALAVVAASRLWSVTDAVVHRGGLLAVGALAALLVGGVAIAPEIGRVLDVAPLAWLGRVSYAVYLVHWPVLIGFGAAGVPSQILPWLTLGVTGVAAWASARWFEQPIRVGRVGLRPLIASVVTFALMVPLVAGAGVRADSTPDFEFAETELAAALAGSEDPTGPPDPVVPPPAAEPAPTAVPDERDPPAGIDRGDDDEASAPDTGPPSDGADADADADADAGADAGADAQDPWDPSEPLVFGYFGDSKAMTLALGVSRAPPEAWSLGTSWARLGCPLGRGGTSRDTDGLVRSYESDYCDWFAFFADGPEDPDETFGPLDVAVVWFGTWDLLERRVEELGDDWFDVDDAIYRSWLRNEYEVFIGELIRVTAPRRILFLTEPSGSHAARPERLGDWRRFLDVVAAGHPGIVEIVDVAAWVDATGEPELWLPDGVHPTFESTTGAGEGGVDPGNTAAALHEFLLLPVVRGDATDGSGG